MLHINPKMLDRLRDLEEDILARRQRAESEGRLGEIEGQPTATAGGALLRPAGWTFPQGPSTRRPRRPPNASRWWASATRVMGSVSATRYRSLKAASCVSRRPSARI